MTEKEVKVKRRIKQEMKNVQDKNSLSKGFS